MASINNRSPWAVTVRNQPSHYCEFRYDQRDKAEAYVAALAKQGLAGSLKRLENAFQVVARDKGYKRFCATFDTLAEARVTKLNIEAERICVVTPFLGGAGPWEKRGLTGAFMLHKSDANWITSDLYNIYLK